MDIEKRLTERFTLFLKETKVATMEEIFQLSSKQIFEELIPQSNDSINGFTDKELISLHEKLISHINDSNNGSTDNDTHGSHPRLAILKRRLIEIEAHLDRAVQFPSGPDNIDLSQLQILSSPLPPSPFLLPLYDMDTMDNLREECDKRVENDEELLKEHVDRGEESGWPHKDFRTAFLEILRLYLQLKVRRNVHDNQIHMGHEELKQLLESYNIPGNIPGFDDENKKFAEDVIVEDTVKLLMEGKISFPWKKYYLQPQLDIMFDRLQKYTPNVKDGSLSQNRFEPKNAFFHHRRMRYDLKGDFQLIKTHDREYWEMDIITDYFTERERMSARRRNARMSPLALFESNNDRWFKRLTENALKRYKTSPEQEGLSTHSLREAMYGLVKECTQFKVSFTVAVIKMLKATRMLDISSGWGDRLTGAIAAGVDRYVGCDPNSALQEGHTEIINTFGGGDTDRFHIIYEPFQEAALPADQTYDLIFTSPPFFNFEVYTKLKGQSILDFPTYTDWLVKFLFVVLEKAWKKLDYGGHMAIHLSDVDRKNHCCEAMVMFCACYLKDCQYVGIIGISGMAEFPRPVWVFQKKTIEVEKKAVNKKRKRGGNAKDDSSHNSRKKRKSDDGRSGDVDNSEEKVREFDPRSYYAGDAGVDYSGYLKKREAMMTLVTKYKDIYEMVKDKFKPTR